MKPVVFLYWSDIGSSDVTNTNEMLFSEITVETLIFLNSSWLTQIIHDLLELQLTEFQQLLSSCIVNNSHCFCVKAHVKWILAAHKMIDDRFAGLDNSRNHSIALEYICTSFYIANPSRGRWKIVHSTTNCIM